MANCSFSRRERPKLGAYTYMGGLLAASFRHLLPVRVRCVVKGWRYGELVQVLVLVLVVVVVVLVVKDVGARCWC